MITITRSKFGVAISDIFFAEKAENDLLRSSICFYVQAATRHPSLSPFRTAVIDLTRTKDDISRPISKNTRYKINRAEREGLTPRLVDNPSETEASLYAHYYDAFASQKGLPRCNRAKLSALCQSSALLLSSISDKNGHLLAAHAYVKDRSLARVRLLYSASHFRGIVDSAERNRIGRANRFLHWYEILTLKNLGFELYDLGGLPLDSADQEKNDIARFKLEFGGEPRIEYTGFLPTNITGRILLSLSRMAAP